MNKTSEPTFFFFFFSGSKFGKFKIFRVSVVCEMYFVVL